MSGSWRPNTVTTSVNELGEYAPAPPDPSPGSPSLPDDRFTSTG
jgi:hypothetical protein